MGMAGRRGEAFTFAAVGMELESSI